MDDALLRIKQPVQRSFWIQGLGLMATLLLFGSPVAVARGHHSSSCYSCSHRSSSARTEFKRETGYPNGRPGYVIDHIVPLKRGGADTPSNMQWQTKESAKAKDTWE